MYREAVKSVKSFTSHLVRSFQAFSFRRVSLSAQFKGSASAAADADGPNKPSDNVPLKSIDEIPGPKGLPYIGTALDYLRKKDGLSFEKLHEVHRHRCEKYGNIYREKLSPHNTHVVITDYKEYLKVVHADGKMPVRVILQPMVDYRKSKGIYGGLLANGEEWLKYRTGVNKKMLRPKEVAQYMVEMDDSTKDMLKLVERCRDGSGVIGDVRPILFRWSLETINTYLLEMRLGALTVSPNPEAMKVISSVREVNRQTQANLFSIPFYKLFPTKAWREFEKINEALFTLQLKIVNRRMEEIKGKENMSPTATDGEHQSMISYLLTSSGLSNVEATFVLADLMGGAVDTASNTTMWGLYLLSQNPDKQEALYNEISSVVGDKESITPEVMNDLKYTKACVKESMRIHPVVVAMTRILNKDVEVCGYLLPEGTLVMANLHTMLRNPEIFPQPTEFIPERWLTKDNKEDMAVINLVWGHGARMCVGRRLAEQEIYLGLARLVQKYKISYAGDKPPEPIMRLVLSARDEVSLKFTERV